MEPLLENDQMQVPPDGYADDPKEVSDLLSSLGVMVTDVPKDAIISQQEDHDDILSRGLLQLSLKERNDINEEIHGVQTFAPEETPEMLSQALGKMQVEINNIQNKDAYDRSQLIQNTYVNSADFRLRFLRSDLFEAKDAARKMVNFLKIVSELFGDFALRRQVQMSDFSREEMQVFRVGHQQLLPYRDRSGRRIFALVGFGLASPLTTRVKILIYIILAASEDVETQRKGMTTIIFPGTKIPTGDNVGHVKLDRILFLKRVYECLPVRTCSIHFGIPDTPLFKLVRTLFVLSMPQFLVRRMKFHGGEPVERQYSIKSFGVPVELIPLTDTGNIKTTYLKQWMKLRRVIELMTMTGSNEKLSSIIECPGSNDVVFRSGTSMSCHPGNVRFRCMVESQHECPSLVSHQTQAELAEQLIRDIESSGGRFLKWDNLGYWVKLQNRLQIHTKVALSIRDFKYKTKAQKNRQVNQSYTYLFQCQDGNKRRKTNREEEGLNFCRRSWI